MFDKILIANRGEIACRVIRTARRMGIKTVAVYSDVDRQALHVRMADEAVCIGRAKSADSYLRVDRIVDACQKSGAQAVHPGYGFLSENAEFATALDAAGIVFIGPCVGAITSMGDKITSKKLAANAGVNTIPGYTDVIRDVEHALSLGEEIGYPIMLKASAGGGGKGMRVVRNDAECREGFTRATNEARSSFGDDRMFAEKFIEEPRHIEIQLIADQHGNMVHLGERECSIQRRHQKVIEEAPSPFLDDATRKTMGDQAIALARAVNYTSAGTVEFIVDSDREFYFLEMNTRLQVEHPVTELITGQDLVELMIRVAAGENLPIGQEDVTINGWAIECRVYAEDPSRNFLPSIGRLVRYREPVETANVRVDTGIEEGGEVSIYYDPMIAKLISYGAVRDDAIDTMADALDRYYIRGVEHNIGFLNAITSHPRFREARLSTSFIAQEFPDGFTSSNVEQSDFMVSVVIAAVIHRRHVDRDADMTGQIRRFERRIGSDWVVISQDAHYPVTVRSAAEGYDVQFEESVYRITTDWQFGQPLIEAVVNGESVCVQLDIGSTSGAGYRMYHRGAQHEFYVVTPTTAELSRHMLKKEKPDLGRFLLSPMPGLLIRLNVSEGDKVEAGEELGVVEAMKMENSLCAVEEATIARIFVAEGDSLVVDQEIIEFE